MPIPAGSGAITAAIALVRTLIPDKKTPPKFSDAEITAFLTLENESVRRAAAQGIETIASELMMTSRVVSSIDMTTDGIRPADLLKRAKALRDDADQYETDDGDDDPFVLEIVDFDPSRWWSGG